MVNESYFDWTAKLFDLTKIFGKPEALRGIRVLDLSLIIFGPATADYLGELGAEVIRVEMPGAGDLMRIVAPQGYYWKNVSPAFFAQNHSKYHVAIDLHKPEEEDPSSGNWPPRFEGGATRRRSSLCLGPARIHPP